ncbi:hypothetical protein B4N89_13545 [Embleya scabrispora]|uniref:Uncharacterized protein n=1 Tax=Embleya scabrispora TaxID=159449 RepID=A0A1T3NYI5_9ACTN|nr:hypothetical protein [Embleya scabrispora]OPC81824.1 hypothetical protein B4N89_13545 [Embleya scabrispora]
MRYNRDQHDDDQEHDVNSLPLPADAPPADVIAEHWADLRAAAVPGTRRPRASHIGRHLADAIAERDRIERQERSVLGRGTAPAAADLSALDVMRVVEHAVLYVEAEIRTALGLALYRRPAGNPGTVPAACADLAVYRAMITGEWVKWADATLRPVARQILTVLGLGDARPIRLLQPCPWCGSVLMARPAHPLGPHIECTGRRVICKAPSSTWIQGRPMWRWDDLADLGRALDAPLRADRPELVTDVELAGRAPGLTEGERDRLYDELTPGAA